MTFTTDEGKGMGMPEASVGVILQRGGEELLLQKKLDRFTVSLASTGANFPDSIPHQQVQPIPQSQLLEVIVAPTDLEEAMAIARSQSSINFASHVYQLQESHQTLVYLTDEVTIQFAPQLSKAQQEALTAQFSLELLQPVVGIPQTFVSRLTAQSEENPLKIANRLSQEQEILLAEVNIILQRESFYRPQDNFYPQQWYLYHQGGSQLTPGSHIESEKAWDLIRGERSIVVAIMDDAIDINHPDFQGEGKIVAPKDFKEEDFLPLPASSQESHGTACAGVAVAEETGTGVVGVAPGCALMPIRTSGFLDDNSIEALFNWAIEHGADVISCSWGAASVYFPLSLRQKAVVTRAATEGREGKGCVVVFAAGNANRPINGTIYERGWVDKILSGPTQWLNGFAVHPDVITVSACTSLAKKSAYSNWGNNISVCAPSNNGSPGMWFAQTGFIQSAPAVTSYLPGKGVLTTDQMGHLGYDPGNFTRSFGGTSSACPVVAGVAALVLSANPQLSAAEVKSILQTTADKIVDSDADPQLGLRMGNYMNNGHSQWFGYGKVNAFKAVRTAQQRRRQPGTVSHTLSARNNTTVSIPDNNPQGVTSRIRIAQTATIKQIRVTVEIEHEFLGDLEVSLTAPNGKTVLLQNRTLGNQTRLQNTYYPETAPALKELLNQRTQGTWRLLVVDHAPQDTGSLKSWELSLGI